MFDPCPEQKTQIVLRAGTLIRKLIKHCIERGIDVPVEFNKELPADEKNITRLYEWVAPILGIPVVKRTSLDADHLPSPSEMRDEKGAFILPTKKCPKCGKVMVLQSVCSGCKDSEENGVKGVFLSGYKCEGGRDENGKLTGGCGFVDEKTKEVITQRLRREKPEMEIPTGSKEALGIKTIRD